MITLLVAVASAQTVDGFVELRAQAQTGVDGFPLLFVERFRPELQAPLIGERLVLVSTVELALAQGRYPQDELRRTLKDSDLGPLLELANCTWPGDTNETLHVSSVSDYLSVERLYVDAYLKKVDLRVGRQALNWGSAFLVNPTDPFPEVLLLEPWRPRAGVNAARATVALGEDHQLQAVAGSDDTFTRARVAGRATVNVAGTDVSAVGAWRQESEDGLVGLDVRGTLGIGFWGEGALHLGEDVYEEIAVGADYSFPVANTLVVTAQYYRNGAGGDDVSAVGSLATVGPTCETDLFPVPDTQPNRFAPVFRGRDYLMGAVSLSWVQELSTSVFWVQNTGDGTALFVPNVTVAPNGWFQISGNASIPVSTWGDGGELRPSEADLVQTVDLGGTPLVLDLGGLVPSATFSVWTRLNF